MVWKGALHDVEGCSAWCGWVFCMVCEGCSAWCGWVFCMVCEGGICRGMKKPSVEGGGLLYSIIKKERGS